MRSVNATGHSHLKWFDSLVSTVSIKKAAPKGGISIGGADESMGELRKVPFFIGIELVFNIL